MINNKGVCQPFSHLSHHPPCRFSSVSRRTLHNVSPVILVFVGSSLLNIRQACSSPLKRFSHSIYPSLSGLSTGLLPCGFHSNYLLASLSSSIRLACTYHLSLLSSISLRWGFTERSALIRSFLSLSRFVTPLVVRRTFISAACSLEDVLVVSDQHSSPYVSIGFIIMQYMVVLTFLGIHFSFNKGYIIMKFLVYFSILAFNYIPWLFPSTNTTPRYL